MAWYTGISKAFGFGLSTAETPQAFSPKETLGTSGTAVVGGFPRSNEKSTDLIGQKKYKTYDDFKYNFDIVATAIRRVLLLVLGATWRIQPPEGSGAEGERIAEAIDTILLKPRAFGRPWKDVVARQFMHVYDGAAIAEWTAINRDDGLVGFEDIAPRPMHTINRWDVTPNGVLHGVWQQSPWTFMQIPIPRAKLLYCVDSLLSDSPEGTGLLRHIADPARELKRLTQIEGWGFETDLSGVPKAHVPYMEIQKQVRDKKITPQQATDYLKGITSFCEDHVVEPGRGILLESATYPNADGTPSAVRMFDLEILTAQIGSLPALNVSIERKVRQIARVLGVEGLLLGSDGKGSYALSKDKTYALVQIIAAGLDSLAMTFDHDLIPWCMRLNGWNKKYTPTMAATAVQLRDIEMITSALEAIGRAGLPANDPAVNEIRELIGVSPAPEDMLTEDAMLGGKKTPGKKTPPVDPDDDGIPITLEGA